MDKEFFTAQIDACGPTMHNIAYGILRNSEDCRDALQETAWKAWAHRHTLREPERFRPWVLRILVNECHDLLRRRKKCLPVEEVPEPALPPPDPTLHLALMALKEKDRLVLILHYIEGMQEKEMAALLHLPASTVRGRLYRARQALKKELEEE